MGRIEKAKVNSTKPTFFLEIFGFNIHQDGRNSREGSVKIRR